MFSTLSSYIWSSGSEDQTVPDLTEDNLLERGEDEWILVDIVNEKPSVKSGMTPRTRHDIRLYNAYNSSPKFFLPIFL